MFTTSLLGPTIGPANTDSTSEILLIKSGLLSAMLFVVGLGGFKSQWHDIFEDLK